MKKITLGVIGNMGPEADELFQARVRKATGAPTDQGSVQMIVVKNPDIPDRTEAILNNGPSPVSEILESFTKLENNDVQMAVMPCNTAHYFRGDIQAETEIVILDMLEATIRAIAKKNPTARIALLATNGTVEAGIYDQYLEKAGFTSALKPQGNDQENLVHAAIYGPLNGDGVMRTPSGIKAGQKEDPAKLLGQAVEKLVDQGADSVILGCTELPIVQELLEQSFPQVTFVDPMEEVAELAVQLSRMAEERAHSGISYAETLILVRQLYAKMVAS